MSGPSLVRVELGVGAAVDLNAARGIVERWLNGHGFVDRVFTGRRSVCVSMLPKDVERIFKVQIAWDPTGVRRRWELVKFLDPASGTWAAVDEAVPETLLVLPLPTMAADSQGQFVSARLGAAVQAGDAVPPRNPPDGVDPYLVHWTPPLFLPARGDVHPGELGALLCGGSARLKAWTPLPATDDLLRQASMDSLGTWPEARVLPNHGLIPTSSDSTKVVLDIVERRFDPGWAAGVAERGHRTHVELVGTAPDARRRMDELVELANGGRFQALEVALDRAGGLMVPGFGPRILAPVESLVKTYDDQKRRDLFTLLRDTLERVIEGRQLAEGLVDRARRDQRDGLLAHLPESWKTDDSRFKTPDWWAAWREELSRLCGALAKAPDGGRYDPAAAEVLKTSSTRLYQELGLRDVANGLIALSKFYKGLREANAEQEIAEAMQSEADHGAMVASCAMAVVGDRVDVRLVHHRGFHLYRSGSAPDRRLVRSLSWGNSLDPQDTEAWERTAADLKEELEDWEQDNTLFVLAVNNRSRHAGLDAWAVLAGASNVLIVGGCHWIPGIAHVPTLEPHVSGYQHGYEVTIGTRTMRVPDLCGPTMVGALGNSALYLGVDDEWHFGSGSSQATPIIAAACALLWAANPGWTARALKTWVLENGCVPIQSGSFHAPPGVAGLTRTDAASNEGARTLDLKKALAKLQAQRLAGSSLLQTRGGKR